MIGDKLKTIEEKIRNSPSMQDENREAVLALLSELAEEVENMPAQQSSQLAELKGLNDIHNDSESASEGLIQSALDEVKESVREFEENHPRLVQVVNSICTQLSNAGL